MCRQWQSDGVSKVRVLLCSLSGGDFNGADLDMIGCGDTDGCDVIENAGRGETHQKARGRDRGQGCDGQGRQWDAENVTPSSLSCELTSNRKCGTAFIATRCDHSACLRCFEGSSSQPTPPTEILQCNRTTISRPPRHKHTRSSVPRFRDRH